MTPSSRQATDSCCSPRVNSQAAAAPGRQGSQVISRSLKFVRQVIRSNAGAVNESGRFEVSKSSSQVTGCIFSLKKLTTFASKHGATNAADYVKIKQIKRSDMVTF